MFPFNTDNERCIKGRVSKQVTVLTNEGFDDQYSCWIPQKERNTWEEYISSIQDRKMNQAKERKLKTSSTFLLLLLLRCLPYFSAGSDVFLRNVDMSRNYRGLLPTTFYSFYSFNFQNESLLYVYLSREFFIISYLNLSPSFIRQFCYAATPHSLRFKKTLTICEVLILSHEAVVLKKPAFLYCMLLPRLLHAHCVPFLKDVLIYMSTALFYACSML
jgi:hypothetical protein